MTRIVGILSASYSGTTMMTSMLGALPGFFPAGETWEIARAPPEDFACATCGKACAYWTELLLRELKEGSDWWGALARHLADFDWLVASDKSPNFYVEHGIPDHMILQWKDPRGWALSARRHEAIAMDRAINAWCHLYETALGLADEIDSISFVDWDQFAGNPELYMPQLLADLGYRPIGDIDPNARNTAHMIGGNSEARGAGQSAGYKRYFGAQLRRDDRWQWSLTEAENRSISEHPRVQSVVKRLQEVLFSYQANAGSLRLAPTTNVPETVEP